MLSKRLTFNLELIRIGFPPINGKFTDRRRYYDAFYRDGSAEGMIDLIAEYADERLNESLKCWEITNESKKRETFSQQAFQQFR